MRAETPPWRTLLSYVRPHVWAVVGGGLLGLLGGTAGLAQPLAAKSVIDAVSRDGSATGATLLLGGLVLLGAVITALGRYVLERTGESVVLTARGRLIRRMLGLRVSAIDQVAPGDLMSRLTSDITLLRSVTTHSMVNGVIGVLTVLGATALMVTTDLVLMGATLGVFAVTSCAMSLIMPRIARASQRTQAAIGQMGSVLERALGAFRTMKASGAEQREIANATGASRTAWGHGIRAAGWQAAATVVGTVSSQLTFLVVLAVGAARVAAGALSLSALIMFLLYVLYVSSPLGQVFAAVTQWQLGLAAVRRLQEVERLPQEPAEGEPVGTGREPASVTFSGVSFGYRAQPVLRDVTIVVPPRGMTAIVGPSGAGKTTLFALLERFYEAGSGVVEVDGRDVRRWPLAELRAAIGYVEQDAPVLAGTLRDNLCYAAPAATDDEINAVLGMARLTGLLDQLPDGLDTPIGHRGSTLSGGQRQRVAVARALLRRPRLLLLDEVTSQLDAASELALREAIEDVALTTTVVVIAHRLSTVTGADRIVVLDAGMVRAIGTHQELVASDELYRELVAGQLLRTGAEAGS